MTLLHTQLLIRWVGSVCMIVTSASGFVVVNTNLNNHRRQHVVSLLSPSSSSSSSLFATRVSSDITESDASSSDATTTPPSYSSTTTMKERVLQTMTLQRDEAKEYAEMFDLTEAEAAMYGLFSAIRITNDKFSLLGLKGEPLILRHDEICQTVAASSTEWPGFFTMSDLEKAVNDDFLDAARGSASDNTKGWQSADVSQPRGDSFEEARMTFEDVQNALEKGTVIFNSAGAHIPKLAGPSLACADATLLPCALNLYVTAKNMKTSAPPHTDKQDVVVVQTSGRKHWRVYSPANPALKPIVDIFARGKLDDRMPVHALKDMGCELLLETTLNPGDALFVPSGFPHTTDTVHEDDQNPHSDETSIHLTLGIDHRIWELDYLNARRLALRRGHVKDTTLGQMKDDESPFVGKVNELPQNIWKDLLTELPLGLLHEDENISGPYIEQATRELERISHAVDAETASAVEASVWRDTILRVRQQGMELLEIHRDMYLAAIEEGQKRIAEEAMTAHLEKQSTGAKRVPMTPERIQRLSLFRVKNYFDKIGESKAALLQWSHSGTAPATAAVATTPVLPEDWAYTMPVKIGDQVEADLGGAFFRAKVTKVSDDGTTFDVLFFDGDRETGLDRSMIKLLTPPPIATAGSSDDDVDTSNMTPKQLKRWKKQQEKMNKKKK